MRNRKEGFLPVLGRKVKKPGASNGAITTRGAWSLGPAEHTHLQDVQARLETGPAEHTLAGRPA